MQTQHVLILNSLNGTKISYPIYWIGNFIPYSVFHFVCFLCAFQYDSKHWSVNPIQLCAQLYISCLALFDLIFDVVQSVSVPCHSQCIEERPNRAQSYFQNSAFVVPLAAWLPFHCLKLNICAPHAMPAYLESLANYHPDWYRHSFRWLSLIWKTICYLD